MRVFLASIAILVLVGCQAKSGRLEPGFVVKMGYAEGIQVKAKSGGCNPVLEDFRYWVTGGDECFALKLYLSNDNVVEPTLIVAIHGDGGPGSLADKAAQWSWIDQINTQIVWQRAFEESNTVIAVIARPGYPIEGVGRSTGYRPDPYGRSDTYRPRYIQPIFLAIERLAEHYGAKRVVGWGSSGGSAFLSIGAGLYPNKPVFDKLLLGVCPCDVPTWYARHGWSYNGAFNPLDYAAEIPKDTEVILIIGERDTDTYPSLSESFLRARQDAGGKVRMVRTGATHSGTKFTPAHIQEQIDSL